MLRRFTREDLMRYNGLGGKPIFCAYKGVVYDVSASSLWFDGGHFEHRGGADLTDELRDAPHGEEVFAAFPIVGEVID